MTVKFKYTATILIIGRLAQTFIILQAEICFAKTLKEGKGREGSCDSFLQSRS